MKRRAPKASLTVQVQPAEQPMDELDRWVQQYAEAIAKMEGIPVSTPTGQAA